jgi:hypothetical protein
LTCPAAAATIRRGVSAVAGKPGGRGEGYVRTLRPVLAVVVLASAVAFSLAGGAGSGSGATTDPCPPTSGRQFCITVTDTEPVSASVDGVVAYVLYTISVDNVGGTSLTNGVVSTTLTDNVGTTPPSKSSAQFIAGASSSGCAAVSGPTNTAACNIGNLAAGQSLASPLQLVYRTSTTTDVDSTDASVVGAFKEKGNDNQKNDPNPDTLPVVETTTYEPCDDCSNAWAPPGQQVKLGTAVDGNTWGTFTFTNKGQGVLTTLDEFAASSPEEFCAEGRKCFGQVVHTDISTVTVDGLLAWETTFSMDVVAPGVSDRNVVIVHTPELGADPEIISRQCTSDPPTLADVQANGPCLLASIGGSKKAKTLIVRWWSTHNGYGRGG